MNINDLARMADQVGIKLNNDHGCVTELSAAELQTLVNYIIDQWRYEVASMVEQMGMGGYGSLAIAAAIRSKHQPPTKNLGEFIRLHRHLLGMSQHLLAKALNVSQGTIGFWEKGLTSPTVKHSKMMSKLFNVPHIDIINLVVEYKERKPNDTK